MNKRDGWLISAMTETIESRPFTLESVAAALEWGRRALLEADIETPALDARLLLGAAMQCEAATLFAHRERSVSMAMQRSYRRLIEGRVGRRPVSRLLGRRGFWDFDLDIDDSVLDPRPDSETLIEAVLERVVDRLLPFRALDLGVGSGCLLLALLRELPNANGFAVDISEEAVACARLNARKLGLGGRSNFIVGDWGAAFDAGFDIIVANPPYVADLEFAQLAPEVMQYDPALALCGGVDGLDCYRRLVDNLARLLTPGGFVVVECGAGQAVRVAEIFNPLSLNVVDFSSDLTGETRCIIAASPE